VRHLSEKQLQNLVDKEGLLHVACVKTSQDGWMERAVAYFHDRQAALNCMKEIKDISIDGKKLYVAYREVAQPALLLQLPAEANEQVVAELLKDFKVVSVDFYADTSSAVVVLEDPEEAGVALRALHGKQLDVRSPQRLSAQLHTIEDTVLHIEATDPDAISPASLQAFFPGAVCAEALCFAAGARSKVAFRTRYQAVQALQRALSQAVALPGNAQAAARLAQVAIPTLEARGMGAEQSVASLLALLHAHQVLQTDRVALLKLRRHAHIVPTLKQLKVLQGEAQSALHGSKSERYLPHPQLRALAHDPAYDVAEGAEVFDQHTQALLQDEHLSAEPAARYQLLRNQFERALSDAKTRKDISLLLDASLPAQALSEAKNVLLNLCANSATYVADTERLFELYVQRRDNLRYAQDFRELNLITPRNAGDANIEGAAHAHWSSFMLEEHDDDQLQRIHEQGRAAEERRLDGLLGKAAASRQAQDMSEEGLEAMHKARAGFRDDETIVIKGEHENEDVQVSLLNPSSLQDGSGQVWSGIIVDTDVTQKTMPGNRVLSHRALVVIGNMMGTAGFGVGKGKGPKEAVHAAFRAALRNLLHIDLYDNFGIAHDLHGKHNSCHAYIRSTPRGRIMVGSSLAIAILHRIGIGSASVKMVGRRTPYSQTRAIFDALARHENLDELAKMTGRRYLTLRWAKESGI
jgi:ribosomal protein S5